MKKTLRTFAGWLSCVSVVLIMTSCFGYYRSPASGIEAHEQMKDGSKVVFTLNENETVFVNLEFKEWKNVHRLDGSKQKGWVKCDSLVAINDDAVADSLDALREAQNSGRAAVDSIVASGGGAFYYVIAVDSAEVFTYNMNTKEGRKHGKKIGALGRDVKVLSAQGPKDGWVFVNVLNRDDGPGGYTRESNLKTMDKAESDQLEKERLWRHRGLIFKMFFPTWKIILLCVMVCALVSFGWMLSQQRKHYLRYSGVIISQGFALIALFSAIGYMDGGSGRFGYNLLPMALGVIVFEPLAYLNTTREQMHKVANWLYVLTAILCFILYAHNQEGIFWPPIKYFLLNALILLIFTSDRESMKCPNCGFYSNHIYAGETYEGERTEAREHHVSERVVKEDVEREFPFGRVTKVTKYIAPAYVEKYFVTYSLYVTWRRCRNCGIEFKDGSRKKNETYHG